MAQLKIMYHQNSYLAKIKMLLFYIIDDLMRIPSPWWFDENTQFPKTIIPVMIDKESYA